MMHRAHWRSHVLQLLREGPARAIPILGSRMISAESAYELVEEAYRHGVEEGKKVGTELANKSRVVTKRYPEGMP